MMQPQKGSTTKKFLSAEEVARELDVKKFLIRFWEKEFKLKLENSGSGARGYSQEDLKVFIAIKDLVHNKKMSLSQARKQMQATFGDQSSQSAGLHALNQEASASIIPSPEITEDVVCASSDQAVIEHRIQPAVTPEACDGDLSKEKMFMQNVRAFKEQLLNFKQRLDLE